MSNRLHRPLTIVLIGVWVLVALGCASSGSSTVHYGYYTSERWHDPYWGSCCYGDVDVDVHRYYGRPGNRPPGMRPPGMRPPVGLPSRPRPMPHYRARGRRR